MEHQIIIQATCSNRGRASDSRGLISGEEKIMKGERDLIADRLATQPHKSLALLLSWRELRIIEYRYGLSDYTPLTLEEIGIEFGICRERVRQIQNKALEKLGDLLDPANSS